MMNFDEFTECVEKEIKGYMPEEYKECKVKTFEMKRNNGVVLTALTVSNNFTAPIEYLEPYYDEYKNREEYLGASGIIAKIAAALVEKRDVVFDTQDITSYDRIKSSILPRLVNAGRNADKNETRPHRTMFTDLSITYYVEIYADENGIASTEVTNELKEIWGVSEEELYEDSLKNLKEKHQTMFASVEEILKQEMIKNGMPEELAEIMSLSNCGATDLYTLTNESKLRGAVEILNTDMLEKISEKMGGDFYIFPSSIHEVMIYPEKDNIMDVSEMLEMIEEANRFVEEEEFLSSNLYYYDAKKREIILEAEK